MAKDHLCVGILAHVDAGKTTLSEAILYKCDVIRQPGRVDKKDAFLDNNELERERGITIYSKQAVFERGNVSFTLIDTPGHVDFSTEAERALSVLDSAVLVISGTDGVQAHTRTLWKLLKTYDVPTFIFVNKMDREGCDRQKLQQELEAQLSENCVDFTGGLDEELSERTALCDEELMERYLETGCLDTGDIRDLIGRRLLFPCLYGSALKIEGVDELLDCLAEYMPRACEETAFAARVFKISRDRDGGRLTHMKITGGVLKNRDLITYMPAMQAADSRSDVSPAEDPDVSNNTSDTLLNEKVTQIRIYSGDKFSAVDEAVQGMVVSVIGLTGTYAGQALGNAEVLFAPKLVPVMTYRVVMNDRSRLLGLIPKLRILEEEDPSLAVIWNPEVRELQIRVMGDIRLEVIKRNLRDRFGEDVDFDRGSVLYKETVSAPVLGVGHFEPLRHYAEAQLLIEPAERGNGIGAESRVSVNDLELNWQRLIMTHIFEREHRGVLTGATLTDVNIVLVAGRSHLKHTEGGDFRQATYRAIRQGLMRAREQGLCVLLEPYYELTIEVPRSCCGRAMTDIEKRFGRITSQYEVGTNDMVGLTGVAPALTMQGYVKEVSSYTKGLGSLYCTFYGYLPCHNTDEITAASGYDPESDLRNPASSVFCAHGAGFVVDWRDVDSYKHLDWDPDTGAVRSDDYSDQTGAVNYVSHAGAAGPVSLGNDEIDAIIERTAHANRRENTYRNPFRKHRSGKTPEGGMRPGDGSYPAAGSSDRDGRTSIAKNRDTGRGKEKYLLVDGYNIIFAWQELKELADVNVDGARERLNEILCNYRARNDINLIVVYDAYRVAGHPTEYYRHHNINVVYTKEAETADRFIERFAHENAKQYDITVATSDGLEQIIIRGAGCKLMTARDLYEDIRRIKNELHDMYMNGPSAEVGTRLGTLIDKL